MILFIIMPVLLMPIVVSQNSPACDALYPKVDADIAAVWGNMTHEYEDLKNDYKNIQSDCSSHPDCERTKWLAVKDKCDWLKQQAATKLRQITSCTEPELPYFEERMDPRCIRRNLNEYKYSLTQITEYPVLAERVFDFIRSMQNKCNGLCAPQADPSAPRPCDVNPLAYWDCYVTTAGNNGEFGRYETTGKHIDKMIRDLTTCYFQNISPSLVLTHIPVFE